ncbi:MULTISPECIES: hypothetical protein [Rhodococcus]|uniref:hypothetical protein n=1 Tax=Rhodococcus TaxID=1827 RepID=UPI001F5D2ABE|nr:MULTISPECIES: hypothetical protein [Rhodococcus]UTT49696.1 hypothetical protein NMQ04_05700 [Rhodococcus gordoniae]
MKETERPTRAARERARPERARAEQTQPTSSSLVDMLRDAVRACARTALGALRRPGKKLTRRIREWVDSLLGEVTSGGVGLHAVLAGIRAALEGRNPALAALGGLISGLSTKAKIGLAVLIASVLLLGPVLLLVLVLALLVAAVVGAVRSAGD